MGNLNLDKTVIDEIWDEYPSYTIIEIRTNPQSIHVCRGRYLSGGLRLEWWREGQAKSTKPIDAVQCQTSFSLDEPTNHLRYRL